MWLWPGVNSPDHQQTAKVDFRFSSSPASVSRINQFCLPTSTTKQCQTKSSPGQIFNKNCQLHLCDDFTLWFMFHQRLWKLTLVCLSNCFWAERQSQKCQSPVLALIFLPCARARWLVAVCGKIMKKSSSWGTGLESKTMNYSLLIAIYSLLSNNEIIFGTYNVVFMTNESQLKNS